MGSDLFLLPAAKEVTAECTQQAVTPLNGTQQIYRRVRWKGRTTTHTLREKDMCLLQRPGGLHRKDKLSLCCKVLVVSCSLPVWSLSFGDACEIEN